MDSDAPQRITALAFLPSDDYYTQQKTLVIDFKDGVFAKAQIFDCHRLGDEYQSEMAIIDAAYSMKELTSQPALL